MILLSKVSLRKIRRFQAGGYVVPPTPANGAIPNRVSYNVIDAAQYQADLSGLFQRRPQNGNQRLQGSGTSGTAPKKTDPPKLDFLKDINAISPEISKFEKQYMGLYQQLMDGVNTFGEEFMSLPGGLQLKASMDQMLFMGKQMTNRKEEFDVAKVETKEKEGQLYSTADGKYLARNQAGAVSWVSPSQLKELETYTKEDGTEEKRSKYSGLTNIEVITHLNTDESWYTNPNFAQEIITSLGRTMSFDESRKIVKDWFNTSGFRNTGEKIVHDHQNNNSTSFNLEQVTNDINSKTNSFQILDQVPVIGEDGLPVLDAKGQVKFTSAPTGAGLQAALAKATTTLWGSDGQPNLSNPVFRSLFNEFLPGSRSVEEAILKVNTFLIDTFKEHLQISDTNGGRTDLSGTNDGGISFGDLSGTAVLASTLFENLGMNGLKPVTLDLVPLDPSKETVNTTITLDLSDASVLNSLVSDKYAELQVEAKGSALQKVGGYTLNLPPYSLVGDVTDAFTPQGNPIRANNFIPDTSEGVKVGMVPVVMGPKNTYKLLSAGDDGYVKYKEYATKKQAIFDKVAFDIRSNKVVAAGNALTGKDMSQAYYDKTVKELDALRDEYAGTQITMIKAYLIKGTYQYQWDKDEKGQWVDVAAEDMMPYQTVTDANGEEQPLYPPISGFNGEMDMGDNLSEAVDDQSRWIFWSDDAEFYRTIAIVPSLSPGIMQVLAGKDLYVNKSDLYPGNIMTNNGKSWLQAEVDITELDDFSRSMSRVEKEAQEKGSVINDDFIYKEHQWDQGKKRLNEIYRESFNASPIDNSFAGSVN